MSRTAGFSVTTLSDAAGGHRLPSLDVTLAYVRACGADEESWRERWQQVSVDISARRDRTHPGERQPYVGLVAFGIEDGDRFFGRSAMVDDLIARVAAHRFLAVVGPSGVGKSSLLRAGLAARMRRTGPSARVEVLTPGVHPLRTLDAIGDAAGGVVIVDQFEELFTQCHDPDKRDRFVTALLARADDDLDSRVVLGVRADFFGRCARYPALVAALTDRTVLVGPMSAGELREAITGPAALTGLTVERALVTQVLSDARGQPGALPLVSHALLETWRQRRSATLTLEGYQATGAVLGALQRTADLVYAGLTARQQATARRVFLRLTTLGDGTEDTRRRVPRSGLDLPEIDAVLAALVDARLVVASNDTIELAHEALIRSWPRMQEWLNEDREALRIHGQLTEAALDWEELGRDVDALYRGTRLAITREWRNGADSDVLTGAERAFLSASESAERRRVQRRRLLTATLAVLLTLSTVATVVAAWQRSDAVRQRQEATSRQLATEALATAEQDVPQAMSLSLNAFAAAPTREARGALLTVAGRRTYSGRLPHGGMVKDIAFSPDGSSIATAGQDGRVTIWDRASRTRRQDLTGHDSAVRALAYAPGGQWLVTGALNGSILIWDLATGRIRARLAGHTGLVNSVAVSPGGEVVASIGTQPEVLLWRSDDGTLLGALPGSGGKESQVDFGRDGLLVAAGEDGTAVVWDISTQSKVSELSTGAGPLFAAAFSPDGRSVAVAGGDNGDIAIFDARGGQRLATLRGRGVVVSSLAFTPDGTALVAGDYAGTITVWNWAKRDVIRQLRGPTGGLYGVAVSPDGATVAAASRDRSAFLWDRRSMPMANHTDEINAIDVAPDGRLVLSAGLDGSVTVWDPVTHTPVSALHGRQPVIAASFGPDNQTIAVTRRDGTIELWNHRTNAIAATLRGHGDGVNSVAFTSDGRRLVTGSADRTVIVWDVASGHHTTIARHPAQIVDVTLGPDQRTVIAASQDGTVTVSDLATHTTTGRFHEDGGAASADLDPTGRLLALGRQDGRTAIWSLPERTPVNLIDGHVGPVTAVAFSPDGRLLATGGSDRTIQLRQADDHQLWASLRSFAGSVGALEFHPNGTELFSGTIDRTVTRWPTDTTSATFGICRDLHHDFGQQAAACAQS